ncbi:MAG: hypothetical protein ACKOC8_08720 [Pirellulales bacterium]
MNIRVAAATVAIAWLTIAVHDLAAQNDWQFPDPYFGAIEIEKSHAHPPERRPRGEVAAAPHGRPVVGRPRQRFFRPRPRWAPKSSPP